MRKGRVAILFSLTLLLALLLSGCGPTNQPPNANFSANPTSGEAPLEVSFDASGSSDSDGSIISYSWDFGDGSSGSGETVTNTYDSEGNYTVELEVTDNDGDSANTQKTIEVVDIEAKLNSLAKENLQYAESENLQGYMSTIHPDAPGYSNTEQTMQTLFDTYDLSYELQSFEYLGRDGEYASVRIEQLTEKISGPSFQDNITESKWRCKKYNGEWKIWSTSTLDITYI